MRLERDVEDQDGKDGDHSYDVPWWVIAAVLLPIALIGWTLWSLEI